MQFDRQIIISTGNSRKDLNWKKQTLTVSELYERLRIPNRGTETLDEYMRMAKSKQDDLKDVGGFVAGSLNGGRRKTNNVTGRDVITLDFDAVPALGTEGIIDTLNKMGINYCVYSTRKHAPNAPRLRLLIPTDRTMTADEYEPCARRVAADIGIGMADPTTFECGRLMYWPSVCSDSEYVYRTADAPLVRVEKLLGSYTDWHDFTSWPQVPGSVSYARLAVKQGDPTIKEGPVGAFCRVYDVVRAMNELLPGIYQQTDTDPNRYTYTGGSTTGGAVVYDDAKFLFSHHATDPCSGKLVNAFDLVRLHKFGDMDGEAAPDTPNNRLPSYKAMLEYANSLDEVALKLLQERREKAAADFTGVIIDTAIDQTAGQEPEAVENWELLLERNMKTGEIKNTIDNALIILENDPRIRGCFALNEFAGRGEVLGKLPWSDGKDKGRMWSDDDSNALYWWFEKNYKITGRGNIDAALSVHANTHRFNPVRAYLNGLKWDNKPRLDTLFIDYLGAEDSPYTRAVTRKAFTAAVSRAMKPGRKFDNMLILCGPQGVGKSTILDKMSRGWFNDSIKTFEGKEASELLQGVWIVEIAELDAFRRSEVSTIKQFLSLCADRYRPAYGRNVKEQARRCVFFGTCNNMDFLQDPTGNRRFWPVDVRVNEPTRNVFKDLTPAEIDQVWAEAKLRWVLGEDLYLTGELEKAALQQQEQHRESSIVEGMIADFVARKVPSNWQDWSLARRRDWWAGGVRADAEKIILVERRVICAAEIWCELFNHAPDEKARASESRAINGVLGNIPGWKRASTPRKCGPYSSQRCYVRT